MSNVVRIAFMVALAAMLGACDADDNPTAPVQTPNAPIPTTATTGFAISVGVSPNTVVLGEGTVVQITVVARRTDTNELMPRGSTALLSTTNGTLTSEDGQSVGTTITLTFGLNGTALATLTGVLEEAVVRAQIEQSSGEATVRVSEAPVETPFTLIQAVPNFGPPSGGTEVRIEGTGFSLPTEVIFGGRAVPVLDVTSNTIRVVSPQIELPSGQNQTVGITVMVNVGEEDAASGTLGQAFTYTRNSSPLVPKIISVTPTSGPNEGGTRVTIFGEGFGSEVQVFFGASSLIEAPVIDVTPNRILVDTPPATGQNSANLNQVVSVRVRDLRSGFEAVLGGAFQYGDDDGNFQITALSPGEGFYLGGTQVTIFSTGGFEAPVAVSFGGTAQQVVSVSGTEIVARSVPVEVGCGGASGAVNVVNIETGESFGPGPVFRYRTAQPAIASVTTDSTIADVDTGTILAGSPTELTMFGTGFDRQSNPPAITFGSELGSAQITSLDPNPLYDGFGVGDIMVVGIPSIPVPWPQAECEEGGETGRRYTNRDVNLTVTARDTGCTTSINFTYLPSDGSCRITETDPEVNAPVAQFSFSVAGSVLTVTDLSSNSPDTIQWDFGDGGVENGVPGETRMYDYGAATGTFDVKLRATNSAGTGEITKQVTIAGPPVAAFSVTQDVGGDPFTIQVNDMSTGDPTSWDWDFGDGSTASGQSPGPHTYAVEGTYTVSLTVSNASSSDTASQSVTITDPPDPPVVSFIVNTNVFGNPFRVQFIDTSTGGDPNTFTLDFGDGTVISGAGDPPSPQDHIYAAAGTYGVTLTLTNGGGSDSQTVSVTIVGP